MRSPPSFPPFSPLGCLRVCLGNNSPHLTDSSSVLPPSLQQPQSHPADRVPQSLEEQSVRLRDALLRLSSSTYGRGKQAGYLNALRSESPMANCISPLCGLNCKARGEAEVRGVTRLMLVSAACTAGHKERFPGVRLESACWYFRCQACKGEGSVELRKACHEIPNPAASDQSQAMQERLFGAR